MTGKAASRQKAAKARTLTPDEYSEFLLLRGALQYAQEGQRLIHARLLSWLESHDLPTRFEVDKITHEVRILPPATPVPVPVPVASKRRWKPKATIDRRTKARVDPLERSKK